MPGRLAAWHPPIYGATSRAEQEKKDLNGVLAHQIGLLFLLISCASRIARCSEAESSLPCLTSTCKIYYFKVYYL